MGGRRPTTPRAGGRAAALLASLAALLALAVPAGAQAAATGNTTIVVSQAKAEQMKKRGIALRGTGRAITAGRQVRLQVAGGTVGSSQAQLANAGALRIVAGKGRARRVVQLNRMQTLLGPRSLIRGKIDGRGKVRALFDVRPRPGTLALDGLRGTASLRGAKLVWRPAAVRAVRKRLGAHLPGGTIGQLRAGAAATGTDTPVVGPISAEVPRLARPASAVDLAGATVTWWVRSSWIGYLETGKGGTTAVEGAVAGAPIVESSHPCVNDAGGDTSLRVYDFGFPFAEGWYDPPTGTAAIYTRGGTHFRYPGHGIDFLTRNPEIEINGAASRVIFGLAGSGGTAFAGGRAALIDLKPTAPPVEGPAGTFSFAQPIWGYLTDDGLSVFGGFYAPPNNHGFGCFAVSFQTAGA